MRTWREVRNFAKQKFRLTPELVILLGCEMVLLWKLSHTHEPLGCDSPRKDYDGTLSENVNAKLCQRK